MTYEERVKNAKESSLISDWNNALDGVIKRVKV
jgi:hypothetical protein